MLSELKAKEELSDDFQFGICNFFEVRLVLLERFGYGYTHA